MKLTKTDIAEAREGLRKILPPGSKVYTMLASRSRDGTTRRIRVFLAVVKPDGNPAIEEITHAVAQALGTFADTRGRWGVVVKGCGYEADGEVVSRLSYAIHPKELTPGHNPDHKGPPTVDAWREGYSLRYEKMGDSLR